MKRKASNESGRSWDCLQKALKEDPADLGVQAVQQTFSAYLLANAEVCKADYKPPFTANMQEFLIFGQMGGGNFVFSPGA